IPFVLPALEEDNLRLMNLEEIGAMKLEAVTNRKEKKDYYDIAFLFQNYTFQHLFNLFSKKYPFLDKLMVIQALTSVHFADNSLNPVLLKEMNWPSAKKIIISTIERYYGEQTANRKRLQEERMKNAEQLLKNKRSKE
ncbi:MAG: nucleotidyl transferase AbiEii/AbiGii toxin family protein, partial [Segetibacter sp.]